MDDSVISSWWRNGSYNKRELLIPFLDPPFIGRPGTNCTSVVDGCQALTGTTVVQACSTSKLLVRQSVHCSSQVDYTNVVVS